MSVLEINPSYDLLNPLKDKLLSSLRPVLEGKKVIYLDYPLYLNLGDMLIHAGTEELFKALSVNIIKRVSERNRKLILGSKIDRDVVLVFQGGGNFGDLYDAHQNFREEVIKAFPDNQILILPQSVHFNDRQNLLSKRSLYSNHSNLVMCVRDLSSYEEMQNVLNKEQLLLLPDMAFVLYGMLKQEGTIKKDVLLFRRRDVESDSNNDVIGFDWEDLYSSADLGIYTFLRKLTRVENKLGIDLGVSQFWLWNENRLIRKAINFFLQHKVVDTDRLHGMILSLLAGITVKMSDNSYGKLNRYASCWLK